MVCLLRLEEAKQGPLLPEDRVILRDFRKWYDDIAMSKRERRRYEKLKELRAKGKGPPVKGQGKRSKKRKK